MFTRVFSVAVATALALVMTSAPALAQDGPGTSTNGVETTVRGERTTASRLNQQQQDQQRNRRRERAPAEPTPEQNKAAAEALLTATGTTCPVSETVVRGLIENNPVYEVACSTGPGQILIGSTPPQAVDCVVLAGQADITRARDPEADVGLQCQIEANKNVLRVVAEYATAAGLTCTVDQGASVGKSAANNIIYEAGCQGVDGYWMEKTAEGWKLTPCIKVMSTPNGVCRFTTADEQVATVKTWFAGSEAAPCDVNQIRFMGSNANGSFIEAKCGAGDGLIARLNAENAVQQVYPCTEAQRIGGGCKLTIVPDAPTAAAPQS